MTGATQSGMKHVAVAGMGGFAAEHHQALVQMEAEGLCRVVATCDPDPAHPALPALAARGVAIYADLASLLDAHAGDLDMLTLPTPLPLHAEHHSQAVEAGVPSYLEKPPSLSWDEFQSMLEVEKGAKKATHVGFNFVGDPMRRELKQRVLNGEFGRLREVRFEATWPRDAAYYARNDWAGRLRVGNREVNDSVIGNAMAHYVQNLLFWCGPDVDGVGAVREVRAWLARTRPIESFDTALVEAVVGDGVLLRIAATHAENYPYFDRETLILEHAEITFDRWNRSVISRTPNPNPNPSPNSYSSTPLLPYSSTANPNPNPNFNSNIPDQAAMLRHNLAEYLAYVSGDRPRPITRLADAEPFVSLHTLAMDSCPTIADIEALPDFRAFLDSGRWPGDRTPTLRTSR